MNIIDNLVLILPDADYDKIGTMEVADIFEPGKRVSVFGEVLALPQKLHCYKKEIERVLLWGDFEESQNFAQELNYLSLEYETTNELLIGDRVAFRYVAKMNAKDDGFEIETPRGRAILMPYDLIYLAVRNGTMYPVNGWILVEPMGLTLEDIKKKTGGLMTDLQDDRKEGEGIVRAVGAPVGAYLHFDYQDVDEIKVGQKVRFRKDAKTPIEWHSHKELNEGKYPYIRIQRKDILIYE